MTDHQVTATFTDPSWTQRYLELLGVDHPEPSLEALTRLTRAHLERALFGSVTSLLRKRAHPTGAVPPLDLEGLLSAWEQQAGSGVCFEMASMMLRLLTELDYDATLALGTIREPGGHQGVVVKLDGKRYLVDVGNGAPFFDPIPLDGTFEVWHVGLGYRFRPGEDGDQWVQERCLDGVWTPFCTYDLQPATDADREASYQYHHVPGRSWVVGSVMLVRCTTDAVHVLRDASLTRFTTAGKTTETIEDETAYRRLAAEIFGAPNLPIDEARAIVAALQAAPLPAS